LLDAEEEKPLLEQAVYLPHRFVCFFFWSLFGLIVAVARGKVNGKEKGEGVPLVVTGQAVCCVQPATSN